MRTSLLAPVFLVVRALIARFGAVRLTFSTQHPSHSSRLSFADPLPALVRGLNISRCGLFRCAVIALVGLAIMCTTNVAMAQSRSARSTYEIPPFTLRARDVVPRELLRSDYHRVSERVKNDGATNHYEIESHFGPFSAEGNAALAVRIKEIRALAQLSEITRTEAFQDAMRRALTDDLETAAEVVSNPTETAKRLPGGVVRFFQRTARRAKDLAGQGQELYHNYQADRARKAAQPEDAEEKSWREKSREWMETGGELAKRGTKEGTKYAKRKVGYTAARLHWARQLQVDPYSDNEVLNDEINRVALAATAGGLSFRLVPIPSLDVVDYLNDVNDLVWTMDPMDLRIRNEKLLYNMGISEDAVKSLYENIYQTPSLITVLVDALVRLQGVGRRGLLVDKAANVHSRTEATFYMRMANFYAHYHQRKIHLRRFVDNGAIPAGMSRRGYAVLAAPVDYYHWTKEVAALYTPRVLFLKKAGANAFELWVEGGCSARAQRELQSLGFTIHTNAFRGLTVSFGKS